VIKIKIHVFFYCRVIFGNVFVRLSLVEISHTELQISTISKGLRYIEKQHQLAFICGVSIFSSPSAQNKNTKVA
jgi:hypothetical protein